MKLKKPLLCLVILLVALLAFTACSQSSTADNKGGSNMPEVDMDSGALSVEIAGNSNRKIVYSVYCSIESDDIAQSADKISQNILDVGGYIESSRIDKSDSRSNAEYILRVPTEKLNDFIALFDGYGTVLSQQMNSEDITLKYIDLTSVLNAYLAERDALDALVASEANADKIVTYRKQITILNTEINRMQAQKNEYDSIIELSRVTINIYQTGTAPVEVKYSKRIQQVFHGSINALLSVFKFILLALIAIAPFALPIGGGIAIFILIKSRRKQSPKNPPPPEHPQED